MKIKQILKFDTGADGFKKMCYVLVFMAIVVLISGITLFLPPSNMIQLFEKFKKKWGIDSNWDFFVINVVFALAGASIGFERKPIFHLLGITEHTALWIKILVYIPLIIPLYQVNLIVFGFLAGQFDFFWEKEKKMGRFIKKVFTR